MKLLVAALAVLSLSLSTACTTRMGDLTVVSTRLASLDQVDLDQLPSKRRVRGEDLKFVFIFIPFGVPHLEDAIDDALDKGRGDVMTDVTIHTVAWWFLVGQTGIRVTGDVLDTRQRKEVD